MLHRHHSGMKRKTHIATALAALGAELPAEAPAEFRILPAGKFRAVDGRPVECQDWECTDEDGARLVAQVEARQSACVIDYEHATLHAKKTGAKAPAAGWYKRLEWRTGDGLYITGIDWTALAAQEVADKHYRYISPCFSYDPKTGRVLRLGVVSLTNDPGLDGLTDLAVLAAEFFSTTNPQEESAMDELLEQLRWLLNLPVGTTAEEITAQLQKLIDQIKGAPAVAANSSEFNLGEHLATLSALAITPDPEKFAPVAALSALQGEHAELQGKYVALQAEVDGAKLDALIETGKTSGQITPATEAWARSLGQSNYAALSAFLDAAPVVIKPSATQTGGLNESGLESTAVLSAEAKKVCALMGIPEAEYQQTLSASA